MSVEDTSNQVIVRDAYLREHPDINKELLVEGLVSGVWALPNIGSEWWMPGIGTTSHHGMITSCLVGKRSLGIFSKPRSNLFRAVDELDRTEGARFRGVNVPAGIAAIPCPDGEAALVITELRTNTEALSVRDLSSGKLDPRVYTPRDFLEFFVGAIAEELHDKGVTSNDLHTGNLGYEIISDRGPKVIFYDFETATILSDDILRLKKSGIWHRSEQKKQMEIFEREAIGDLATFLAYLKLGKFPYEGDVLLKQASAIYLAKRAVRYSMPIEASFYHSLSEYYNSTIIGVQSYNPSRIYN